MRLLYLLAGLLSLTIFAVSALHLKDAEDFVTYAPCAVLSGLLAASVARRILRHRGIPPALAYAFFQDPPGWKIVPAGDPESAARFEVVRKRG
jgi:hypothetical protein